MPTSINADHFLRKMYQHIGECRRRIVRIVRIGYLVRTTLTLFGCTQQKRPLTMILCGEKTKQNQNIHISAWMRLLCARSNTVKIEPQRYRYRHTRTQTPQLPIEIDEQQYKATRKKIQSTHSHWRWMNRDGSITRRGSELSMLKKHWMSERSNFYAVFKMFLWVRRKNQISLCR